MAHIEVEKSQQCIKEMQHNDTKLLIQFDVRQSVIIYNYDH